MAATKEKLDMSIFYKASGCKLSQIKLENPEHQALLEQAIATPVSIISNQGIVDVLYERWQVSIGKDVVNNHRAVPQKCACRNIPKDMK